MIFVPFALWFTALEIRCHRFPIRTLLPSGEAGHAENTFNRRVTHCRVHRFGEGSNNRGSVRKAIDVQLCTPTLHRGFESLLSTFNRPWSAESRLEGFPQHGIVIENQNKRDTESLSINKQNAAAVGMPLPHGFHFDNMTVTHLPAIVG